MYPAPPTSRRRAYAALPATWAAVILLLTLTPANRMPRQPHWELLAFDTAAHAAVFWVLAVLCYFSARRQWRFPRLRANPVAILFVACSLFGTLIEIIQMWMDLGRNGEWSDILSDSIGTVLGLGMAWLALRYLDPQTA